MESVSDWSDTGAVTTDAIYAFCGRCYRDVGATQDANGEITLEDHECVPPTTADLDAAYQRARESTDKRVKAIKAVFSGDNDHLTVKELRDKLESE